MPISKLFSGSKSQTKTRKSLNLEVLEERMMLSSVEIFAAGATGQENLELFINGEQQQTFLEVGGDASARQFQRFTFQTDQTLTPGDIGIGFANDAFDPSIGLDRDLIVDRIVVDGVTVQAEDSSTFSTGIYRDGGLTGGGFLETEVLNINGVLTFADPASTGGDRIEFDALGTTGEEYVDILINGQNVAFFNLDNPGVTQTFSFTSDDPNISIEDVRLEFVNDLFDPSRGIDRNVQISEFRVIDGETGQVQKARTTDANVITSGIFVDGTGITEGFGTGGFIAGDFRGANGFVEISGDGGSSASGDRIEFDALGTTGEEYVDILINGQNVAFFNLDNPGVTQTFSFTSDDPNISIEDVRLEFVNDLFDPSRGIDRNVQIFEYRVIDGDTGQVTTARTTEANVLNSGIFADGGITQGFGTGGFIAGDFQGANGFVQISGGDNGGGGGDDGATGVVTSIALDSNFQITEGVFAIEPAVGPGDRIASVNSGNQILVVGSDGVPLSSFGGDGLVDLDDLLGLPTEFELHITDLEFFDDGSVLATGFTEELGAGTLFGQGPASPVIAKLNPDGTLDQSFTQQGFLQGTFLQLPDNGAPVIATIDPQGRVVVFGTNVADPSNGFNPDGAEPTNYIVSRLNPDGTLDSTFGNNGNVFIDGSSFPNSDFFGSSGDLVNIDVLDNNAIVFGFGYTGFTDNPTDGPISTSVIGRLAPDGSVDQGFADNGFFIRNIGGSLFQLTPDDGVVIAFTSGDLLVPSLLVLNSNGQLIAETVLTPNSEIANATIPNATFIPTDELAIDSDGNIVVRSSRSFSFFERPSIIQVALPSGELNTEFGLDGGAVLGDANDIIFDSQNRLVVVGDDLSRFEIV